MGKGGLSFKQLIILMILITLILFGFGGYVYYKQIFTNPDRVLNAMLNKSLQVNSIQRKTVQAGSQSATTQTYYNTFSPQVAVESHVELREGDIKSGRVTKVTNETIATPTKDFIRYTSVTLPEGSNKRDFGKILNQWAKREKNEQTGEPVTFFDQSIFAVVPFGSLDPGQRKKVTDEVNSTNLYDYKSAKVSYDKGRPIMEYSIDLKPESLLKVLSVYADVTGYGDKEQLNPEQYKDSPAVPVKITVDLLSRHVRQVQYTGAQQVDRYGSYGLSRNITLPTQTIGIDELQKRLQEFQ